MVNGQVEKKKVIIVQPRAFEKKKMYINLCILLLNSLTCQAVVCGLEQNTTEEFFNEIHNTNRR